MLTVFLATAALLIGSASQIRLPSALSTSSAGTQTLAHISTQLTIVKEDTIPAGGGLRERLRLFNPEPLFFSVETGGEASGPEALVFQQSSAVLGLFPSRLPAGKGSPAFDLSYPTERLSSETTAAKLTDLKWFMGLAREIDPELGEAPPPRAARVEVSRVGESRPVAAMDLVRAVGLEGALWSPCTLTVLVSSSGIVGKPQIEVGSGADEIDEKIRSLLARDLLPNLNLRPGVYRLQVAP
ncbi:MAG: hypothetical protein EAZ36_02920 [Verrucomicrobia bacterium]|nr:MAG: hypothetical protein EAZ36_02920 [Verrucomicrobiota bacterium]